MEGGTQVSLGIVGTGVTWATAVGLFIIGSVVGLRFEHLGAMLVLFAAAVLCVSIAVVLTLRVILRREACRQTRRIIDAIELQGDVDRRMHRIGS